MGYFLADLPYGSTKGSKFIYHCRKLPESPWSVMKVAVQSYFLSERQSPYKRWETTGKGFPIETCCGCGSVGAVRWYWWGENIRLFNQSCLLLPCNHGKANLNEVHKSHCTESQARWVVLSFIGFACSTSLKQQDLWYFHPVSMAGWSPRATQCGQDMHGAKPCRLSVVHGVTSCRNLQEWRGHILSPNHVVEWCGLKRPIVIIRSVVWAMLSQAGLPCLGLPSGRKMVTTPWYSTMQ